MRIGGSDILSAGREHRFSLGIRRLQLMAFFYLGSGRQKAYRDILVVVR